MNMSQTFKDLFQDRRASFKTPPATIRDAASSQEARRKKALEEQKRRRAERFDSSRQLDFFADLNLGPSDDEGDEVEEPVREGISQFASLLGPSNMTARAELPNAIETPQVGIVDYMPEVDFPPVSFVGKKKPKNKRKNKPRPNAASSSKTKPSKWADKCMYAELLEMTEDPQWTNFSGQQDGIPNDLEGGWVAVAPVPIGKRCLAITHAPSGIAGVVPNTTLRSRVLGKSLMKPFPSALPPHTIIDCIIDENWRDNGIVHVLDVIKWKGQDIADCETPFRFWWRDTRLAELPIFPPPPNSAPNQQQSKTSSRYRFQYPITFSPIPSHTNLTLSRISTELIPLTRATRQIPISIPIQPTETSMMDLDTPVLGLQSEMAETKSDGLLLYVAQATYEPGQSPLSSWIPLKAYVTEKEAVATSTEGPLDMFERLVKRRLTGLVPEENMDMM